MSLGYYFGAQTSAVLLIIANLIPLWGVLFLGWELFDVMFLYWLESAIIGFFFILRFFHVAGVLSVILIPFFVFHYGMFMGVHFIFIYALFGEQGSVGFPNLAILVSLIRPIWPAFGALVVSHGFSYVYNFLGNKEYRTYTPENLMSAPYRRIIIMHVTIIFGGFATMALGTPVAALALLIGIKLLVDVWAHTKEHKIPFFGTLLKAMKSKTT